MPARRAVVGLLSLFACAARLSPEPRAAPVGPQAFDYPVARRDDVVDVLHGLRVPDPYRWLEGDGPDVSAWVKAEDLRARRELGKLPDVEALWRDVVRIWTSIPPLDVRRGANAFYRSNGKLFMRSTSGTATEIFDTASLPDEAHLTSFVVSIDGSLVALEVSKGGADMRTLRVLDVTARALTDELTGIEGSDVVWAEGGFFYAYTPPDAPHATRWSERSIRFHHMGDVQADDRVIVAPSHDMDASAGMNPLGRTTDGRWLLVRTFGNWSQSRFAVVDPQNVVRELSTPSGEVTGACVVGNAVFAAVRKVDQDFDVMQVSGSAQPWRLVTHTDARLLDVGAAGPYLVLTSARTARSHHELFDAEGNRVAVRESPLGTMESISSDPGSLGVVVQREGLRLPPERIELDPHTGRETQLAAAPLEFDASQLSVVSLDATSPDGTRVPITVLRRRDLQLDGRAPLWTFGYGGFRVSAEPRFFAPWTSWVLHGGVFALCHIRGGAELGEPWHIGGARRNRQRSLDDFAACIEQLHRDRYSSPARTMTQGWSHGGLLVSAVAMQHPDLQRVVLATVPLEDMVRFPLFGRGGVSEYGDPSLEEDLAALLSWSPYHHVEEGTRYPSFLITASSNDERAAPMHPRKFVAALQYASAGGEVLFKVNWGAGHLGGGTEDANRVFAEAAAFAYREFGL